MTTTQSPEATVAVAAPKTHHKSGRWIDDWRPEDVEFWEKSGKKVARRNLFFSIFCEHIGFSVWVLWSVFVLFIPNGQYGISFIATEAAGQKFLLVSLPALLGSFVRLPYTLAVAKFGGRNWTIVSALLLLIPCIAGSFFLVPSASFGTLLMLAVITGLGGGNFASSMTNINHFYPQRLKGWALGLNAGGGNLGVAAVQLIGLVVLATAGAAHPRYMFAIYIPAIVIAALGAYFTMDNLSHVKNEKRAMRDVLKDPHTYVMSFLYIGTFGSFIGFGFAFGQVLSVQFADSFWAINELAKDPSTRTPISIALENTDWFKNPSGTSYWDLLHHKAVAVKEIVGTPEVVTDATGKALYSTATTASGEQVQLLTAKLGAPAGGYNPDPSAAALPVKIGHRVDGVQIAYITFLGPLIGSVIRPVGGALADRFGGARTTFVNFIGMAVAASVVLTASVLKSLPLFVVGFIALFVLAGIGNGSTYKMIPTIFRSKAQLDVAAGKDETRAGYDSQRLAGALIGIAGAVGAFGGVLVNVVFRSSFLNTGKGDAAYLAFIAFYVACVAVTWFFYLRRSPKRLAGV